jgi:predicted transcriptional regulator
MEIQVIIKAVVVVIHTNMVIRVNNKSTDGGDTHTYGVMRSNKSIDDGNTNYGDTAQ